MLTALRLILMLTVAGAASAAHALENPDWEALEDTAQHSLEYASTDESVPWVNPDSGAEGTFTPVATHEGPEGQVCREYAVDAIIDGREEVVYGTACRLPDGSWVEANDDDREGDPPAASSEVHSGTDWSWIIRNISISGGYCSSSFCVGGQFGSYYPSWYDPWGFRFSYWDYGRRGYAYPYYPYYYSYYGHRHYRTHHRYVSHHRDKQRNHYRDGNRNHYRSGDRNNRDGGHSERARSRSRRSDHDRPTNTRPRNRRSKDERQATDRSRNRRSGDERQASNRSGSRSAKAERSTNNRSRSRHEKATRSANNRSGSRQARAERSANNRSGSRHAKAGRSASSRSGSRQAKSGRSASSRSGRGRSGGKHGARSSSRR
jgi:surface antigen